MNNKYCFEALDKTLQDLQNNFEQSFGGMSIVLGGDFRQILLVIPSGTKEQIIDETITNSYLWPYFRILTLTQNMILQHSNITDDKQKEIIGFSYWILNIENSTIQGIQDEENDDIVWVEIPKKYIVNYDSDPIKKIFDLIYNDFINNFNDIEFRKKKRAFVAPKNTTVNDINNNILSVVPGEQKCYYSCDTIIPSSENIDELNILYLEEFLHTLNFNGVLLHELNLKVGIPVMLL